MTWLDPYRYQLIAQDGQSFSFEGYLGLFHEEKALQQACQSRKLPRIPEDLYEPTIGDQRRMAKETQIPASPASYPEQSFDFPPSLALPSFQLSAKYWSEKARKMRQDWQKMEALLGENRVQISHAELQAHSEWMPTDWILSRHYRYDPLLKGFFHTGENFAWMGFFLVEVERVEHFARVLQAALVFLKDQDQKGQRLRFHRE